jgi:hypothetical protein
MNHVAKSSPADRAITIPSDFEVWLSLVRSSARLRSFAMANRVFFFTLPEGTSARY